MFQCISALSFVDMLTGRLGVPDPCRGLYCHMRSHVICKKKKKKNQSFHLFNNLLYLILQIPHPYSIFPVYIYLPVLFQLLLHLLYFGMA